MDERLPENAMVLGIRHAAGDRAYPLDAVQRSGGVVHDTMGGEPIVVWSPHLGDPLMGAFSRRLDTGDALTFALRDGVLFDDNTSSEWSFDGIAVSGKLAGRRLVPLECAFLKWHAWSPFHPDTELYWTERDLTEPELQTDAFSNLFRELTSAGFRLRFEGQPLAALRPNEADAGAVVKLEDDRFVVYRFRDTAGAEEFFYGATHHVHAGRYVLKSEPAVRFADNAQLVPLSEEEMGYSRLLQDGRLGEALEAAADGDAVDPQDLAIGLSHVFERLKKLGYRIDFKQQLEGRRLPVEALNGYELAIDCDGFLVYRFEKPASASEFSAWHGHSRSAGPFVFRSDPPGQYKAAGLETNNQPDESIEWSSLLEDDEFARALESIVAPMYPSLSGS